MSIWKKENKFNDALFEDVENFFEQLNSSKIYEYREGQETMALDVLDALKNKEILLIEAGVGIGKSLAYLIPLLYASKNTKEFKGFLISTSSIALQEQLKQEIKKLSEILNIEIPVTIAKGRNNYICQKRLEEYIKKNSDREDLREILKKVEEGIIDKEEYKEITNKIWKNININYVNCSNCLYKNSCKYMLKRRSFPNAKYVICNHDLLVESLKRDINDLILQDPDILIVDEAHNLEEKIRNSYQDSINKNKLEALILKISFMINDDDIDVYQDNPIIETLNKVFRMISTKAKYKYRKNAKQNIEMFDEETSGFDITDTLKDEVLHLTKQIDTLIKEGNNYKYLDKRLVNLLSKLKYYNDIFKDLISVNSKNIYWVSFLTNTKDHISLEYVKKDIYKEAARLLSNDKYAKVFTSATMTTNGNYNYFAQSLGLNEINGIRIVKEFPQISPYNYNENALLYLANDVISPKSLDRNLYYESLSKKINELIGITEGRSLVLFTSKKDMLEVYNRIILNRDKYNFNIMIQTDNLSTEDLKNTFKNDISSVLFATGSFFEGIDVKGEALENVIITKLPFPVVNPIIEEKASHYTNGFEEIYLPEMIIKLKQGTGRLIRSSTDKGIVSILDSRCKDYQDIILNSLPFTNFTDSLEDVSEFANRVLGKEKIKKYI